VNDVTEGFTGCNDLGLGGTESNFRLQLASPVDWTSGVRDNKA